MSSAPKYTLLMMSQPQINTDIGKAFGLWPHGINSKQFPSGVNTVYSFKKKCSLLQHVKRTYKHIVQTNSKLFQCQFSSVHNYPFDYCLFISIWVHHWMHCLLLCCSNTIITLLYNSSFPSRFHWSVYWLMHPSLNKLTLCKLRHSCLYVIALPNEWEGGGG